MDHKQEFLAHLQDSFREYFTKEKQTPTERAQAKSYINGLMVAGRMFGIGFDELQQIMTQEQSRSSTNSMPVDWDNKAILDIPTYIRDKIKNSKQLEN
jgi:hypothetical protein